MLLRAALAAAAALLAGCGQVECVLEHVPEGMFDRPGRTLWARWGADAAGPWVVMNGFDHRMGDEWTAHVETSPDGFHLVVLQDFMGETPDGRGVRHTSADHWRLAPGAGATMELLQWDHDLGPATGAPARAARSGQYVPDTGPVHLPSRWTCE